MDLKVEKVSLDRPGHNRLRDVTGADAAGADFYALHGAIPQGLDFLKVWVPGSAAFIVGMAHIIPEAGTLATYFAYSRHCIVPS